MTTVELLAMRAEMLSVTDDPSELGISYLLFEAVLDLFNLTYFNPGEPETECGFCGRNRALPGAYDVLTSEEEESGRDLDCEVYWARVWATRALSILESQEEPCCKEHEELWEALDG